ncbi:MAG: hypothetical protein N2112_08485 [Gemmataceae bacterium]|nr:hypothetical protein [Gemmataceae bacterium]
MFRIVILTLLSLVFTCQIAVTEEIKKVWIESIDYITDGKSQKFDEDKKTGLLLPPDSVKEEIVLHVEGKYPDMVLVLLDLKEGQIEETIKPRKADYKIVIKDGKISVRFAKSTLKAANVYWITLDIRTEDQKFRVEKYPLYIANPLK